MPSPDQTAWSEYHRVPSELANVFDFLNTKDERHFGPYAPGDELADRAALARWLAAHDLIPSGLQATTQDLELAHSLREVLRECAESNQNSARRVGTPPVLVELPLRAAVHPDGGLHLRPLATGVPGALATLLAEAVTASANGSWWRVKMCAATDCRVVFFDHSKPRNGRWCHTMHCGNRIKVRSYRRRKAQVASA